MRGWMIVKVMFKGLHKPWDDSNSYTENRTDENKILSKYYEKLDKGHCKMKQNHDQSFSTH